MVLVVAVNGILVILANDTWSGLETHNAYRKGIEYNKALAGAKAQAALGWTMDMAFADGGGHRGDLTVTFRDGDGGAVTGLEVEARIIRPTHEGYDQTAALGHRGGGVYGAAVTLPLPGQWAVRIHARRGRDAFQATHRIQVR